MEKRIGVFLSGCGFLDGAEIREATLTALALSKLNAQCEFISINEPQHHTINHFDSSEDKNSRNILEESARIARQKIKDINDINISDLDGIIFPGGFGVAKNFCDFAFKGHKAKVHPKIKKIIENCYESKKPIGSICISPALIALVLGSKGIGVSIGVDKETAAEIEKTGAKHFETRPDEIYTDVENKIVSTPAYMYDDASLWDIYNGIEKLCEKVISI